MFFVRKIKFLLHGLGRFLWRTAVRFLVYMWPILSSYMKAILLYAISLLVFPVREWLTLSLLGILGKSVSVSMEAEMPSVCDDLRSLACLCLSLYFSDFTRIWFTLFHCLDILICGFISMLSPWLFMWYNHTCFIKIVVLRVFMLSALPSFCISLKKDKCDTYVYVYVYI